MKPERTQTQSDTERQRAREKSLARQRPPAEVPGIDLVEFLGEGAFGEVWIGLDANTGRQVAVKFFARRRDLAWAGMSSEVEKLVLLSNDRRIVQLLKVGWQTDPPYFVMEFLESGSLDDDLREHGRWSVEASIELFTELAKALEHAHAKGVLHCDLKPANVLLDHDHRPRLCDFGQSRLAQEQRPALGTFFYMAPEQASLEATPDVRWDVYGLGAILYTCLVGHPPYWNENADHELRTPSDLAGRLEAYRQWLSDAGPLSLDRRSLGIDKRLAAIVTRCLERDPKRRFANIQAVLNALEHRAAEQRRRPLLLLGGVAPLLLVLIMALFAWRGMRGAVESADVALTRRVRKSNEFAAQFVAARVTADLERYFSAVERRASDPRLLEQVRRAIEVWRKRADPGSETDRSLMTFQADPDRQPLQEKVRSWMQDSSLPQVASWFVCGPDGTQLASVADGKAKSVLGQNFAYRTYFHGGPTDFEPGTIPDQRLKKTQISALMLSTATGTWKVAVSTPLVEPNDREPNGEEFLGVVVVTFEIGRFISFFDQGNAAESRFAVLVDGRPGPYQGVILQHPLYSRWRDKNGKLPDDLSGLRVDLNSVRGAQGGYYVDPLASRKQGHDFHRPWIVAYADVELPRRRGEPAQNSGLVVLIQEDHNTAVAPVVKLQSDMQREGAIALGLISITVLLAWYLVLRRLAETESTVLGSIGRRHESSVE